MWKVIPILARRFSPKQCYISTNQVRLFLSESFKLENAWNGRVHSPILKRININDMFYELDHQFQNFARASALDIDIFVNAVNDDSYFDEVEEVIHKLRLSPDAINILPSTHHALVRLYLKFNKTDDLLRILDDRLNYGIFPDDYLILMMMNTFIKTGNYRDAAKVSNLCMLQEDVSNPIIRYMALYSCHQYLANPVQWTQENNVEAEGDDDDEEVKVRVRYIRNPFFDDHFDLVDPQHLIGKTLTFIGSEIDDHIGRTYTLLGLLLHDKFEKASLYADSLLSKECSIVKDGLAMVNKCLDEKSNLEGKSDDFKAKVSKMKDIVSRFSSNANLIVDSELLSVVESRLIESIDKNETSETQKQLQLYKDWEQMREELLMEQIAKINRKKQLEEVQLQKKLLKEKEEELFFFDNEEKLNLIIEEKDKEKEDQRRRVREAHAFKSRGKKVEEKKEEEPPLESHFDENIPIKLVKTKL